jgi:hypothetical protein
MQIQQFQQLQQHQHQHQLPTITNTMNNNNMNRRTRQRVAWSEEEIRLLINQRRHRNLEYYRTPGRSRTAFWNSVARRINRSAGSNFTGNQCKRKFENLVTMYNVSKIIKIKGNIYILK